MRRAVLNALDQRVSPKSVRSSDLGGRMRPGLGPDVVSHLRCAGLLFLHRGLDSLLFRPGGRDLILDHALGGRLRVSPVDKRVGRPATNRLSLGFEPDFQIAARGAASLPPEGFGALGDFLLGWWIHKGWIDQKMICALRPGRGSEVSREISTGQEWNQRRIVDIPKGTRARAAGRLRGIRGVGRGDGAWRRHRSRDCRENWN